jgi:ribosomal subunit interface protein
VAARHCALDVREVAMTFRVSGKNIDIGEALRTRIDARIKETVGKYFDGGFSGHATVCKEGYGFKTQCAIHLDTGTVLHVDGLAADAYASSDQAALRVEQRLRRYKNRLKRPARRNGGEQPMAMTDYVIAAPEPDAEADATGPFNPTVIAESTSALETLSVSEAVMELDLTGAPLVTFRHGVSGRVNVVYRRADGNIGWIDPGTEGK